MARREFQLLVRDDCPVAYPPQITIAEALGAPFSEGDTLVLAYDDPRCVTFYVKDVDAPERISFVVEPVDFTPDESLQALLGDGQISLASESDSVGVELCLPQCPYTDDGVFVLHIIGKDQTCAVPLQDTLRLPIRMEPVKNALPEVVTDLPTDTVQLQFDNRLDFNVLANDPDGDPITLVLAESFFNPEALFMEFTPVAGDSAVSSPFSWQLNCDLMRLGTQDYYPLTFSVQDEDRCFEDEPALVTQVVQVLPFANDDPVLTVTSPSHPQWPEAEPLEITPWDTVLLDLWGQDANNNGLLLAPTPYTDSLLTAFGVALDTVRGQGEVTASLALRANCAIWEQFRNHPEPLVLDFVLEDEFCLFPGQDRDSLRLQIINHPAPSLLTPQPNIFTPNGDGFNDTFSLVGLPPAPCDAPFEELRVINRWGQLVYVSDTLDFVWDAGGVPDGVYFWVAQYAQGISFKGTVTLRR